MQRTALIFGATGLVGKHLLNYLLNDNYYTQVIALLRSPLKIQSSKLLQLVVDFDELPLHLDEITGDDVFCCLGTTIKKAGSQEAFSKVDHDYVIQIASAALKNGAGQFLFLSSIGADASSSNFYYRTKGKVEKDLIETGYKSIHIFRPSLMLGDRDEVRLGESLGKFFMKTFSFALIGKAKKYKPIKGEIVASAMNHSAKQNYPGIHVYESDQIQLIGEVNLLKENG